MRGDAEAQQEREWALAQGGSSTSEGLCIRVDWANRLVEVNQAGITKVMPWKGAPPWPGDAVRIISAGLRPMCELIEGSPMGTVSTVAAAKANVTGDDGVTYTYPYVGGAPANGARVRIDHAGRVVSGTYSSEPAGSTFQPAPAPPVQGGAAWFVPAWSGNWSDGSFEGDAAEISDSRTSAYGYKTQIPDTVPGGATVTVAQLHLVQNWDRFPGVPSSMGTHTEDGRPGSFGDGNLSGVMAVPGGSVVVDLMGAFANALRGGALGLGFRSHNGWRQYAAAPASGRIYMEWSS